MRALRLPLVESQKCLLFATSLQIAVKKTPEGGRWFFRLLLHFHHFTALGLGGGDDLLL